MACKASFELHHNFPRIAEESGFAFNTHRPRVQIDWNKIKLIDIESLVRNRTFTLVEQHIHYILDCVIDLEFDVRILDEGFLKIFRLAQLAVEYQQFCRHYLDRSVILLREEITKLRQELDSTKNGLKDKEEEIKKIKRKMKQSIRTPLPYGNENIASMILKTLNQGKNDIFASTSQVDTMYYNKCNYCDKVFLNQLYLKSHISRRHEVVADIPQRDIEDKFNASPEFNNEISELKLKLKQLEDLLTSSGNKNPPQGEKETVNKEINHSNYVPSKVMKDAEVSATNEEDIIEKIQKWKMKEQENYSKEINLLRTQIVDLINNQQIHNNVSTSVTELAKIEELQKIIKEQGTEILTLKEKLQNKNDDEAGKRLEIESQINYWTKQVEMQSSQFATLLQKFNIVENEAREYRAKADAEAQKSIQLQQLLLQEQMMKKNNVNSNEKDKEFDTRNRQSNEVTAQDVIINKKPVTYDNTFKKLQQKAQELLSLENINSSDTSSVTDLNVIAQPIQNSENSESLQKISSGIKNESPKVQKNNTFNSSRNSESINKKYKDKKKNGVKKIKQKNQPPKAKLIKEKQQFTTESPIRIIRAKMAEEVNIRLSTLGVDPLKNRLPKNIFLKQRLLLQEQHGEKSKQFPMRDNVLHRILSHIDARAINSNNRNSGIVRDSHYVSPKKSPKSFSLSSVLSNVKTKTLSFVKSNDNRNNTGTSYENVAKKAIAFLKTPPGSANSSPKIKVRQMSQPDLKTLHNEVKVPEESKPTILKYDFKTKSPKLKLHSNTETDLSDEENFNISMPLSTNTKVLIKPLDRKSQNIDVISIDQLKNKDANTENNENSSDGIESLLDSPLRRAVSEDNLDNIKQTKGVLKNASSTSSINKKKVLFDMNAIQIKSLSASPSQSTTEKSEVNEQYELGIQNLDADEWDLSSIENLSLPDPTKESNKVKVLSHQSPKIAELKQTIESQLARRNPTLTTGLVGGVDVLSGPLQKGTSLGGSNTSLGSSILDESEIAPIQSSKYINNVSLVKNL